MTHSQIAALRRLAEAVRDSHHDSKPAGEYLEAVAALQRATSHHTIRDLLDRLDEMSARAEAAEKDAERLDWLDRQGIAYGFEDMHEGNSWIMDGPFNTLRSAIDAAITTQGATNG